MWTRRVAIAVSIAATVSWAIGAAAAEWGARRRPGVILPNATAVRALPREGLPGLSNRFKLFNPISVISPARAARMMRAFDGAGVPYEVEGRVLEYHAPRPRWGVAGFYAAQDVRMVIGPEGIGDEILSHIKVAEPLAEGAELAVSAIDNIAWMYAGAPMPTRRAAAAMAAVREGGPRVYVAHRHDLISGVYTSVGWNAIVVNIPDITEAGFSFAPEMTPEKLFIHEAAHYLDALTNDLPDRAAVQGDVRRALIYRQEVWANYADWGSLARAQAVTRELYGVRAGAKSEWMGAPFQTALSEMSVLRDADIRPRSYLRFFEVTPTRLPLR